MSSPKFLFSVAVMLIIVIGCHQDDIINQQPSIGEIQSAQLRSYNQEDCGFIEAFCERKTNLVDYPDDPHPQDPALVLGIIINDGGNSAAFTPVRLMGGSIGVLYETTNETLLIIQDNLDLYDEYSYQTVVPKEIAEVLAINYADLSDLSTVISEIGNHEDLSISSSSGGTYTVTTTNPGTTSAFAYPLCQYYWTSDIESFVEVFFEDGNASHIRGLVEDAFMDAKDNCSTNFSGSLPQKYTSPCSYSCVDPRCIVDYLLNLTVELSDDQKQELVSRYLQEALGLTDGEQDWLTLSAQDDFVYDVYNGLQTNQAIGRCDKEDCGLSGGYHELIFQQRAGESLTIEETTSLLEFFSIMRCDAPVIYQCFREAQQNPSGTVATFLNDIKSDILSNNYSLIDPCDDLSQYADRWTYLATLDPLTIPTVAEKIDDAGYEYWIQTLENAQPSSVGIPIPGLPYAKWWIYMPTVNMDYFGITINDLPNNPNTSVQFTPTEFFNYVQLNFESSEFYGDGSPCSQGLISKYFEPNTPADETLWTSGNPVSSIFTIHLPDDGSVICTEYSSGNHFIFSTINAPGWFNGDNFPVGWTSWDGYHPVSGNREFGLTENGDGTYTFYTTGVDRVTGWWHAITENLAYEGGDEFWKCFMDTLFDFVQNNGGTASSDYNCTTVRPKWDELKENLKDGCEGLVSALDDYPCEQAEPCQ